MQVKITTLSVDERRYKRLAVCFFSDEKPPRGICGLIDWRLGGLISRELAEERITGSFQEQILLARPQRIVDDLILLYGMGSFREMNCDKFYATGLNINKVMMDIYRLDYTLALPQKAYGVDDFPDMVAALLNGCYDASRSREGDQFVLPEIFIEPPYLEKTIEGAKRFKKGRGLDKLVIQESREEG